MCMDHVCSALKVCVHKGPIFYNDILFSHQSEPHSKSSRREHCSLSQPGSQESKSQPQFSLARCPQHVTLPPLKSLHAPLSQPRAMQSAVWQGSAGLTVPRQLREGSDFVLVRRTGKGRQQRVKTGFLTPAAPDKACSYPRPKGKGQVQSRPTSLNLIPQNPATAWLLDTILEAGGSKASVFSSSTTRISRAEQALPGTHLWPTAVTLPQAAAGWEVVKPQTSKGKGSSWRGMFSSLLRCLTARRAGGKHMVGMLIKYFTAHRAHYGPDKRDVGPRSSTPPPPPSQEMLLYFLGRLPGS